MSDLFVSPRLTIPDNELSVSHSRSSGPGGQNVNKVNSRVTLRWSPRQCGRMHDAWKRRFINRFGNRINAEGELVLHSDRYRDQHRNLVDVRQRLCQMLCSCQSPPKKRKPTKPTRGSNERRLERKKQKGQKKKMRKANIRRDW